MAEQILEKPWWLLPTGRIHASWWVATAAVLLWLDYTAGPANPFPVVYVIPVSLAAWYSGRWAALALAVAVPVVHVLFLLIAWQQPGPLPQQISATAMRAGVIVVMALWFSRLSEHERALQDRVQTLEGLLPICSYCKKIRNETGDWERLERYISTRSGARFSHSYCPTCLQTFHPELLEAGKNK